jgi:MoaA/NifB/PqqE/SkfB family radical SAM enzyme
MCPYLQALDTGAKLPAYSPIESIEHPSSPRTAKIAKGETPRGPLEVNSVFDLTCNLSCPSCRKEPMGLRPGTLAFQQADKMADEIITHLPTIRRLKVAGNGDPFASRAYWKVLTAIDRDKHPNLRVMLHTNAILFTAERWSELKKAHGLIDTVEVAVDAASGESYALNRRGGSFETLTERLNFIAKLRSENTIGRLLISFVVQANNFLEMPAFVEFARGMKADTVIFNRLNDWGSLPAANFAARAIHRAEHPKHAEFLATLANPIFGEAGVFIGNLSEFRPR